MDIVKRAYLQTKNELPPESSLVEVHKAIVLNMVRWIKLRVYSKRDWPKEFGPYPQYLESMSNPLVSDK